MSGDNIDKIDQILGGGSKFTFVAHWRTIVNDVTFFVDGYLSMSDVIVFFIIACQIYNLVGDLGWAIFIFDHLPVRRFQETVFIDPAIKSHVGN